MRNYNTFTVIVAKYIGCYSFLNYSTITFLVAVKLHLSLQSHYIKNLCGRLKIFVTIFND